MKILILFLIILTVSCNNKDFPSDYSFDLDLDSSKIYLAYRGTDTKEGIIAKNFNISNEKISHIGIGVHIANEWKVFHVVSNNTNDSDLTIESFESFSTVKNGKVHYMGIYELKHINDHDQHVLLKLLQDMTKKRIKFDNSFSIKNEENSLYCSEFVVNMLSKMNNSKFHFNTYTIELNSFQAAYLKKKKLSYYPADIFLKENMLKLVKDFDFD